MPLPLSAAFFREVDLPPLVLAAAFRFRALALVGGAGSFEASSLARLVKNLRTVLSSNCIRVKASSTAMTDPGPYVGSCTLAPTSKRFMLGVSSLSNNDETGADLIGF